MKTLIPLLALPLFLTSCVTTDTVPAGKKAPDVTPKSTIVLESKTAVWNDMDDVRAAVKGKPVTVSGTTLDLKGSLLSGKKLKRYDNIQDERNEPLRVNVARLTVKNGYVKDIPGGIVIKAPDVTVEDVVWLNTGEDSVSNVVDKAPNTTIRKCTFYGATDKSVQMNCAKGLVLDSNTIHGGVTGARIGESKSKSGSDATKLVRNMSFNDVDTAFNVSRAKVVANGTKYKNVRLKSKTSNGGRFKED